ncbi:hypothetical protein I7I53_03323 [Histoplasma capsulatum var. duboisii H88]|uniref:Uncharacterized protein n=1 Tax=Ajellomyces capsulatus (strain H88) TaxID=544711 RepID=A0A8A1LNB5_AJEC8|nr:hypothetical protein I7I53_03323 [Histoplasma capsulatum var. duboisii H88]
MDALQDPSFVLGGEEERRRERKGEQEITEKRWHFIYQTQIDRRKTKDAQSAYGSISDCTLWL